MAVTVTITCPSCHKTFRGRQELAGKNVRCPACRQVFAVRPGETLKVDRGGFSEREAIRAAPQQPAAVPPPAAPPPPPAALDEDEENSSSAYTAETIDIRPRCPNCANPLPSDEVVICTHCGYNTQTRTAIRVQKAIELTTGDYISWLLPGLLCAAAILLLIGGLLFYNVALPRMVSEEPFYVQEWLRLWVTILVLGGIWPLGRIAMNRLILNPSPPQKIKGEA